MAGPTVHAFVHTGHVPISPMRLLALLALLAAEEVGSFATARKTGLVESCPA